MPNQYTLLQIGRVEDPLIAGAAQTDRIGAGRVRAVTDTERGAARTLLARPERNSVSTIAHRRQRRCASAEQAQRKVSRIGPTDAGAQPRSGRLIVGDRHHLGKARDPYLDSAE